MPEILLAAAVVILDDHVLIVRRSWTEGFLPGRWGVPCGKIDRGERPEKAVLRELREETGLAGIDPVWVGESRFSSTWRGREARNLQHNYLISVVADPVAVDNDGRPLITLPELDQKATWMPTPKISGVDLDDHNLRTIRQAMGALARF